jgi:hypothetical protein
MRKTTMLRTYTYILTIFFLITHPAFAVDNKICASDIPTLKQLFMDQNLPLRWIETSMDDNKPLLVDISQTKTGLHLEFNKTSQGLWAKGNASICADQGQIIAQIAAETIEFGPTAPSIMKKNLGSGVTLKYTRGKLTMSSGWLLIGWTGHFIPRQ